MAYLEALILVIVIGVLFYKWATANYGVWEERGVPHIKPLPLIGTINLKVLLGKISMFQALIDSNRLFKDHKVYGSYNFRTPMLIVRDLELIKKIGIKDFDNFPNHRNMFETGDENILTRSLFVLRDRRWKEMRNTLTPSFTGNKMRLMFHLVNECCMEGVKYVEEEVKATGKNELEIEMKDFFTRYTNDVIASTSFGIKVNSFKDKTNEFYTIGSTFSQFRGWVLVKFLLYSVIPKVMEALRLQIMDEKSINFFKRLVTDAITYRKEHNIIRPDMIHLLMEAKRNLEEAKSELKDERLPFSNDDLLAQCFIFFLAGFETTSVCLCFTLYELMMNQDVQQRLYEEVLETEKELNGKPLDYDTLMKMKYMDMVLSESLRKWPPVIMTDRVCAADYKLTDEDGNLVAEIKKDEVVLIPTTGLHYDPANFENPYKFDPDRFSNENKHLIKPMSYVPFGMGPRNCIGNRFAQMEIKALIYQFLLKFNVVPGDKAVKDMMSALKGFQMIPPEKFWMKFVPRENK